MVVRAPLLLSHHFLIEVLHVYNLQPARGLSCQYAEESPISPVNWNLQYCLCLESKRKLIGCLPLCLGIFLCCR
uniref:Cx9C motif-containing protein 4 n=1 Tax=Rhizophora mucronata TaxID=61149 RepID=A0A2P2JP30_RHIMU